MSLWTVVSMSFRADRPSHEINEELESHFAEAIERGRDPEEARKAAHWRAELRHPSAAALDSLREDTIFG